MQLKEWAKLSKWSSEFLTQLQTSAASPRALRATERSIPLTGLRKSSASPSSSGAGTRSAEAEGGTEGIPSRRAAPKRGSGGGRGGGAGGAAGLVAGVIAVSMVPRSGGPGPRAPSALMLPPQLFQVPQLPAVRPPLAGGPLQGAAGMPELAGALCFAAWLRRLPTHGPRPGLRGIGLCTS